jgi:hypothetical protein
MDTFVGILYLAFLLTLAGGFVFLCIIIVRRILQRLLSPRLIRIYEALKPLFDPSYDYDPKLLERSYWMGISVLILIFLTISVAFFFDDLFDLLRDLVRLL